MRPPQCLTSAGSSLLTPAVWPQVCLQPRLLHARPAALPPAGAQGLPHCPLLLWFKPQVHLAGMHPALRRLSSPVLIPVRFRARESFSDVQCLACASRSVPLKWVPGGRPVASQGLLGFHKPLSQGTVSAPLPSVMAPRPRTIFTEHLREASSSPVPSSGLAGDATGLSGRPMLILQLILMPVDLCLLRLESAGTRGLPS